MSNSGSKERNAIFSKSIYLYGAGGALTYTLLYAALGIYPIIAEELLISFLFLCCHLLAKKDFPRSATYLGVTAIIYSCARTSWLLGWHTEIHIYILAMVPLIANAEKLSSLVKKVLIPLLILIDFSLWFLLKDHLPPVQLATPWNSLMGQINIIGALGVITLSYFFYGKSFLRTEKELEQARNLFADKANTDALTGSYNRQFIENHLIRSLEEAKEQKSSLVAVLLDIDNFKSVNDTYGHNGGDIVLKTIVERIRQNLREGDYLGRWGGEEFLIIFRDCPPALCREIVERIRCIICDEPVQVSEEHSLTVTATLGLALGGERSASWKDVIAEADEYLYEGKKAGKNRVVCSQSRP